MRLSATFLNPRARPTQEGIDGVEREANRLAEVVGADPATLSFDRGARATQGQPNFHGRAIELGV